MLRTGIDGSLTEPKSTHDVEVDAKFIMQHSLVCLVQDQLQLHRQVIVHPYFGDQNTRQAHS